MGRGGMNTPEQGINLSAWFGNVASAGVIVSTMLSWLPQIAAIVALIWYIIQIYESPTLQRWFYTRRTRRIARMKAAVLLLEAQNKPLPSDESPIIR